MKERQLRLFMKSRMTQKVINVHPDSSNLYNLLLVHITSLCFPSWPHLGGSPLWTAPLTCLMVSHNMNYVTFLGNFLSSVHSLTTGKVLLHLCVVKLKHGPVHIPSSFSISIWKGAVTWHFIWHLYTSYSGSKSTNHKAFFHFPFCNARPLTSSLASVHCGIRRVSSWIPKHLYGLVIGFGGPLGLFLLVFRQLAFLVDWFWYVLYGFGCSCRVPSLQLLSTQWLQRKLPLDVLAGLKAKDE